MNKEEINLLLKDLGARLSYGVICQVDGAASLNDGKLIEIDISKELVRFDADVNCYWDAYVDDVKPYLRSMSSMTEEEKKEYCDLQDRFLCSAQYPVTDAYEIFDWLNAHHFDYRGLIEKGLAIEVTKDNNPYKE